MPASKPLLPLTLCLILTCLLSIASLAGASPKIEEGEMAGYLLVSEREGGRDI